LDFGRGANDPTPEKFTVTETPETYGRGQDPYRIVAPLKEEKKKNATQKYFNIKGNK
jgi:hypothetical protein